MPVSLMTITSGYTFENAEAPLLQKYVHSHIQFQVLRYGDYDI